MALRNQGKTKTATAAIPKTPNAWRAFLNSIREKKQHHMRVIDDLQGRAGSLACRAALGDEAAIAEIEAIGGDLAKNNGRLDYLAKAEAQAETEISVLDAADLARHRQEEVSHLEALLLRRLEQIEALDGMLRKFAAIVPEVENLSASIINLYGQLGGARQIIPPLSREAFASRLSEFLYGLGLSVWLPVACAATKTPPDSLLAEEKAAQSAYRLAN